MILLTIFRLLITLLGATCAGLFLEQLFGDLPMSFAGAGAFAALLSLVSLVGVDRDWKE